MNLDKKQSEFLERALGGQNIFLTGKAGTGKSFIVKELIRIMQERNQMVVAAAPTGIAATNIGGATIHSLFSLGVGGVADFESCNFVNRDKRKLWNKIETIIFDEVSMLRPDTLDAIHWTMRKNGCEGLDRKQLIFVGDLKQLPPIISEMSKSIFYSLYKSHNFFDAEIYNKLNIKSIELDEVLRQSDNEFIENLNIIREGGKSEYFRRFVKDSPDPDSIILAPHNDTVGAYNSIGLKNHEGEIFENTATIEGKAKFTDFNLEENLKLKSGCRAMHLINKPDSELVNGSIGEYKNINGAHFFRFNNVDYGIEQITLSKREYVYDKEEDRLVLKEIGSIKQYPLKLAYALTIHKSQGLTFDRVTVDLSKQCFADGQQYVAFSRVTSPEGLTIYVNR